MSFPTSRGENIRRVEQKMPNELNLLTSALRKSIAFFYHIIISSTDIIAKYK